MNKSLLISGSILALTALALGGCAQPANKPQAALRSPPSSSGSDAFEFGYSTPHPVLVVGLPNHPGQKPTVTTIAGAVIPHKPAQPANTGEGLPTKTSVQVIEEPPPTTQPAASTRPSTASANATDNRPSSSTQPH
ncbi:MAG: hypothetical protein HKL96_02785 [Phycisphaerales bacterium]|nr:hypothetical protein [Phycisphaerales bacterium]